MKLIALSCLFLSLHGYLAASVISASTVSGSSPKDWSFQSLSGPENGELSGSLLESLSGVTATGKGVIIGIIDTGIDWRHPDFRDPADTLRSRILAIWDRESSPGGDGGGFAPGGVRLRPGVDA